MKENLKLTLAKHTKLELATMLAELFDGQDEHDIHHMTGLSQERCKQIAEVGREFCLAIYR